jgi:hypothetical protein
VRKVDFRTVVVASAVSAFFAGMPPTACANEAMTVTVTKGGLQSFGGFGMHKGGLRYRAEVRDTVNALIIKPLHVTFIRFYVHGSSVDSILADFDTLYGYPDGSTMFDDFLKQNPNLMFLLAQAEAVDTITGYEKFCAKWAKAARKFGEEKRVPISWTGITSEPNVGNNEYRRIALELYPDVVKGMRAALDAEGLDSVKIYIPEVSNVDSIGRKYVGVTKADAEAWKCVDGLITKAYNMNADMYYKRVAQESQLPYFVAAGANLINFYNIEASNDNDHYAQRFQPHGLALGLVPSRRGLARLGTRASNRLVFREPRRSHQGRAGPRPMYGSGRQRRVPDAHAQVPLPQASGPRVRSRLSIPVLRFGPCAAV